MANRRQTTTDEIPDKNSPRTQTSTRPEDGKVDVSANERMEGANCSENESPGAPVVVSPTTAVPTEQHDKLPAWHYDVCD